MKQIFVAAAAALAMAVSSPVFAHGALAKHGGVVASAGDLAFELVAKDGKAVIHVDDHGRALSTREASGKLTVLQGKKKSETTLEPGEPNTLTSADPVKLVKGAKAVASITLAGKEPISVRFSLK